MTRPARLAQPLCVQNKLRPAGVSFLDSYGHACFGKFCVNCYLICGKTNVTVLLTHFKSGGLLMKSAVLSLLTMLSLSAFAGTSKTDPNVAKIRDDFMQATPILSTALQLDQTYFCYLFQAWSGPDRGDEIIPNTITFHRVDGILLMKIGWERFAPDVYSIKEEQTKISVKIPKTASTVPGDDLNFRSAGGNLYIEESTTPSRQSEDKSPSNVKASTQNYRVCAEPVTPSANSIP
jgi:hypothetical protein